MTSRVLSISTLLAGLVLASATGTSDARYVEDPVVAANLFRGALLDGNTGVALSLLATDALIYQSGEQQASRDAYAVQRLKQDAAYFSAFFTDVLSQKSLTNGDLSWVSTRLRLFSKDAADTTSLFMTETQVLRRASGGWTIVHIHRSLSTPGQQSTPSESQKGATP
jgi:ketosteroid isomerase-like protein